MNIKPHWRTQGIHQDGSRNEPVEHISGSDAIRRVARMRILGLIPQVWEDSNGKWIPKDVRHIKLLTIEVADAHNHT